MKPTYTYFAWSDSSGLMKIGQSVNPLRRMKELPGDPRVVAVIASSAISEADAHKEFAEFRRIGEWFDVTEAEVLEFISSNGFECITLERIAADQPERTRGSMTTVTLTVDDELLESAKVHCKEQGDRSLSSLIREALAEKLARTTVPGPTENADISERRDLHSYTGDETAKNGLRRIDADPDGRAAYACGKSIAHSTNS